jgi:ABC-2 type transport system ATP-binding protein
MAEVARLAQRIGIIHKGHLLQELTMEELEHNRRRRLLIRTTDVQAAHQTLTSAGHPAAVLEDGTLQLKAASSIDRPEEINSLLVRAGTPPTHLAMEEEDLEQYFLRLIGGSGGAA